MLACLHSPPPPHPPRAMVSRGGGGGGGGGEEGRQSVVLELTISRKRRRGWSEMEGQGARRIRFPGGSQFNGSQPAMSPHRLGGKALQAG